MNGKAAPSRRDRREFERLLRRFEAISGQIDTLAERVRVRGGSAVTPEEAAWARDALESVMEPLHRLAERVGIDPGEFDAYTAAVRLLAAKPGD